MADSADPRPSSLLPPPLGSQGGDILTEDLPKSWLIMSHQIKLRPWADPPCDLPASWTCPWLCSQGVLLSSRLFLTQDCQCDFRSTQRAATDGSACSLPAQLLTAHTSRSRRQEAAGLDSSVSHQCWRCPLLLSFSL